MTFFCRIVIFLAAISALICHPLLADERRIRVGFSHWPPMKIVTPNDFNGIDAELLRLLSRRLNVQLEFVTTPWKRAQVMLAKGEVDLLTSIGKTAERMEFAAYVDPPYHNEYILFYMRKNGEEISEYQDISAKTIGILRGSSYFEKFDRDESLNKITLDSEEQLLKMLLSKRLDCFVGFETPIDYAIAVSGLQNTFQKSTYRHLSSGFHLALSKKSSHLDLLPQLSRELTKVIDNGEIHAIRARIILQLVEEGKK